jgi:hypothetical protein
MLGHTIDIQSDGMTLLNPMPPFDLNGRAGRLIIGRSHPEGRPDQILLGPKGIKAHHFNKINHHLGQSDFLERWWLIIEYSPVKQLFILFW